MEDLYLEVAVAWLVKVCFFHDQLAGREQDTCGARSGSVGAPPVSTVVGLTSKLCFLMVPPRLSACGLKGRWKR